MHFWPAVLVLGGLGERDIAPIFYLPQLHSQKTLPSQNNPYHRMYDELACNETRQKTRKIAEKEAFIPPRSVEKRPRRCL